MDLDSTNYLYVNGERISEQTLKTGDEIRTGPYRLVYEGSQLAQCGERRFIRIDALHSSRWSAAQAQESPPCSTRSTARAPGQRALQRAGDYYSHLAAFRVTACH